MSQTDKPTHDEKLAGEVADAAVHKVFAILGVDVDDPESIEEFREDLRFGKQLRKVANKSVISFWGAIATLVAGALGLGLVESVKNALGK